MIWWAAGIFAVAFTAWVAIAIATDGPDEPDPEAQRYAACERAAKSRGIDPYGNEGLTAIGLCMQRLAETTTSTTPGIPGRTLELRDACARHLRILSDLNLDDQQMAEQYSELADMTADDELRSQFWRFAGQLRSGDDEIPMERANELCRR